VAPLVDSLETRGAFVGETISGSPAQRAIRGRRIEELGNGATKRCENDVQIR